jgi:hypothetical protein
VTYRDGRIEIEPPANHVKLVRKGKLVVAHLPDVAPLKHADVNRIMDEVRRRKG